MAIYDRKYRLILLAPHNSARIIHVCCYLCRKTRGWNGFQSTKFILNDSNPKQDTWACSKFDLNSTQSSEPKQQNRYSDWDTGWRVDEFFSISLIQSNRTYSGSHPSLYLKGIGGNLSGVNGTQHGTDRSKQPHPLWAPPNLVFEGYRGKFVRGKWDAAWSWPLTSIQHRH